MTANRRHRDTNTILRKKHLLERTRLWFGLAPVLVDGASSVSLCHRTVTGLFSQYSPSVVIGNLREFISGRPCETTGIDLFLNLNREIQQR